MKNIRKLALETLLKIDYDGAYSNLEIKRTLQRFPIKDDDRRLYLTIVYGCLQNQIYLDYLITQQSSRPVKKLHKEVSEILRIAIYQLYFLDKIPNYAIVNEAVNLAAEIQPQAKGFINGVLRNIMRKIDENGREFKFENWDNEKEALSIRYSVPLWIVHKYYEAYGAEKAEAIMPMLNEKPPFTVRCNTLKTSKEQLIQDLQQVGVDAIPAGFSPNAIHLTNLGIFESNIENSRLYRDGHFSIQDQAAMLTVERLNPQPGDRVLDMCAAPGGKTMYLSEMMNNSGEIVGRDVYGSRLKLVEQSASRLGCTNIRLEEQDGCEYSPIDEASFDKILLDAPCTGLGVIRRKPEIKYRSTKEGRKALVKIQSTLLENAVRYLKPGGELLYSTCTINKDENENQIGKLLIKFPQLQIIPDEHGSNYTYTSPLMEGSDCFFMCQLKKMDVYE
ncbi:16S rRNA (cytosine(967)-C(5))-methyltransferase RsmB [Acetobacterium wieringae]|uniref:16S rRNA (cytosine(967)-C(5))-methyltransferase n=1 Tax=Acetobacterium wieringae TaxID=52694 RepID=A0A5D0WW13_9FIRM|nr:16S rRNA (cytosine(967)-C(5))-methyltransferase RsmB [Acetobacterium wieringae]TYC88359.1 16S rRNA (cytosine(967)-C(5))-methyltransferase RsmB [Acetobacterium wieringae]